FARRTGRASQCLAASPDVLAHVVGLDVAQDGGLDSAVGKVHPRLVIGMAILRIAVVVLDLGEGKLYRLRIAVPGQEIDGRPSRISQFQQLGNLVESLAGGVIARVSY